MRDLLFLSHRIPYPPDKGEKIRGWNLLGHLAQSYNIHLGCLIDDAADWQHLPLLRERCAEVAAFGIDRRWQKLFALARARPGRPLMLDYYRHRGLLRWVDDLLARRRMDVLYIYSAAMAPYVLRHDAGAHRHAGGLRVLDMQDIDSEKWAAYAGRSAWPMRLVWAREGRTLLAYERRAAAACDNTLFVTEAEARRFVTLAPESAGRVDWLENGVDLAQFNPALDFANPYAGLPGDGPDLVFTGNMDYWPNVDAAVWFAENVLTRLQRIHAGLRLHVVGANPALQVKRLVERPGVYVTGRVPDVRPYVAHAALAVAPLRIARGIQNKVLEAMAMAKPVVASRQAFEGIHATPGRDLLVGDGAPAMVQDVLDILDGRYPGLPAAARAAVEARYSWPAQLVRLDRVLAGGGERTA